MCIRDSAYVGTCLYCPEGTCTRPEAKPCRHPELVRPSLEACGFDIAHTTSDLFGIELKLSLIHIFYTALNPYCGWIGETSTEIFMARDMHIYVRPDQHQ